MQCRLNPQKERCRLVQTITKTTKKLQVGGGHEKEEKREHVFGVCSGQQCLPRLGMLCIRAVGFAKCWLGWTCT